MTQPTRENTPNQITALPKVYNIDMLMQTDYRFMFDGTRKADTRAICPVDALNRVLRHRPEFNRRTITQCNRTPFLNYVN